MAQFCIAAKMSPTEYRQLSLVEFNAFIEVLRDRAGSIEDIL